MKKETISYYIKKYKSILFIVSLALSLYGSYLVYHGKYEQPLKEVSIILFSTFKLFTFAPTNAINQSPLAYELAVWLAPTSTVIGFLTMFQKIFQSIRTNLYHLKKADLIIMGNQSNGFAFIKNLYKENPKTRIIYLMDKSEEMDETFSNEFKLEVVKLDFNNPNQKLNAITIRDKGVDNCSKIISFEPEPRNYGRLLSLQSMLKKIKKSKKIQVFLQIEDIRMREMVELRMDQLDAFDIHYFKIEDLLVKSLLEKSKFKILPPQVMNEKWSGKNFFQLKKLDKHWVPIVS